MTRPRNDDKTCSVAGCEQPRKARGCCHGHYQRLLKYGSAIAEVPLGGVAMVAAARRDDPNAR